MFRNRTQGGIAAQHEEPDSANGVKQLGDEAA